MLFVYSLRLAIVLSIFLLLHGGAISAYAGEFYAAPDANGDGTFERPWSLSTALGSRQVQPGDTLYLRGGTYRGTVVAKLAGTSFSPIIVRPYARERVILDGSLAGRAVKNVTILLIEGGYVHYRDLEITNSDPERNLEVGGSNPANRRGS